jgi:hypothetical protein
VVGGWWLVVGGWWCLKKMPWAIANSADLVVLSDTWLFCVLSQTASCFPQNLILSLLLSFRAQSEISVFFVPYLCAL